MGSHSKIKCLPRCLSQALHYTSAAELNLGEARCKNCPAFEGWEPFTACRVRYLRETLGLSIQGLLMQPGFPTDDRRTLILWEHTAPPKRHLKKIALSFGMDPTSFFPELTNERDFKNSVAGLLKLPLERQVAPAVSELI